VNGGALGTVTQVATSSTQIAWDGERAPPDSSATALLNILGPSTGHPAVVPYQHALRDPPAMPTAWTTPGVPGIELGHGFSTPANPFAILWPDGLGFGTVPGIAAFAVPGPYTYLTSPPASLTLPPGLLAHGDYVEIQFLAVDQAYPSGIGVSQRAAFVYSDCATVNPGPHAHIEARGAGAQQVQGFWEVWNTGTLDITRVVIDASTCLANGGTATGWEPTTQVSSGGSFNTGTTYRFGTHLLTGLQNYPPGFTGTPHVPPIPPVVGTVRFDFSSFRACTSIFVFDSCSWGPNWAADLNLFGSAYVGATVTVTFAGGLILSGFLTPDPNDPFAAILDL
jgi:hypothetical protein